MALWKVRGTSLYVEEEGQGPPLLFIHGMCGRAQIWRDQISRLSTRFRCVAYDRRGHTRSPLGDVETRTVQMHADDAAALITAMGLAPAILVSSSGGARVAFDVVRRYPQLIRGAVMSEPPLWALYPEGAQEVIGELRPAIEQAVAAGGPRAGVDAFFTYVCPGLWRGLSPAAKEPYRDNHVELYGDLQMPPYEVSISDLAQIDRPCLVLRGSESLPTFRRIASVLAEGIPGARLVTLQGSGHVTYYERPAEFAAAVAEFADQLTNSRQRQGAL
ncbi:MAG: alpha/beta fold hydrolase [Chloroflexota bacterium]